MTKRYWDEVEIGHRVSEHRQPPISRSQIARLAGASDDFAPINLDDEFAQSAGFASAVVPSIFATGLLEEFLGQFAKNALLLSISVTFLRLIWPKDSLTCKGIVVRRYKKSHEHRVQISHWIENQNQEIVLKGESILSLFKNAQEETKDGHKVPLIAKENHTELAERCQKIIARSQASEALVKEKELV